MFFAEVGKIEPLTVEVFSLARNSWTKVGANFGCSACDRSSSVVVNGCVHWFAYRTKDASAKFILAFDFGSEEFGEIMLPEYHHNGDTLFEHDSHEPEVFLTVLRESLSLIASCCKNRMVCYNIWVMREYGIAKSWSKQYSVVPNERVYRCFGIVNNKDLMLQADFEKGVISYDLDKQEYKPLGFTECLFELVTFRESLVLYEEGFTPQKDLLVEKGICVCLGKWKSLHPRLPSIQAAAEKVALK
ncbi:hypothetical protein EZV62_027736 [Acer yangbiense]|uniref:F-box associated beta-propeller type 1 domain-containing protein n=1 Tax=Acer yangbiense TaxID=1000413 RepID=A0A5C7GVV5_9ROSI|nr:hypothetical protein EZV62_027736 [Acer yangbiense]